MSIERSAGILLPIFSLPSNYGIGTLGREAYGLPDNMEPVAFLPLGYPAEGSHPAKGWHDKRKSLEETVEWL